VVLRWEQEKRDWLARCGLTSGKDIAILVRSLSAQHRAEFQRSFSRSREEFLDTCHSACELKIRK